MNKYAPFAIYLNKKYVKRFCCISVNTLLYICKVWPKSSIFEYYLKHKIIKSIMKKEKTFYNVTCPKLETVAQLNAYCVKIMLNPTVKYVLDLLMVNTELSRREIYSGLGLEPVKPVRIVRPCPYYACDFALRVLRHANLITNPNKGKKSKFSINKGAWNAYVGYITNSLKPV